MDIPVSRVSVHPWRIIMRFVYRKLMVKWLPFLAFLMVLHCFPAPWWIQTRFSLDLILKDSSLSMLYNVLKSLLRVIDAVLWFTCFIPGHGGFRTAEYLKKNLFNTLRSHPNFIKDTKLAIGMNLKTERILIIVI